MILSRVPAYPAGLLIVMIIFQYQLVIYQCLTFVAVYLENCSGVQILLHLTNGVLYV